MKASKRPLLFLLALACINTSVAQDDDSSIFTAKNPKHVYHVNYWVTIPFNVVATGADIYAIPTIIKGKRDLTDEEFKGIEGKVHNNFDKWALDLNPSKREQNYKASDYTLPIIIAATGALAFDKEIKGDWFKLLMMYYEMHAVTFSIYNFSFFGPAFQNKLRPVAYYDEFPDYVRKRGNQRNSMYSGHTATAVASTYFMVKVYSDYHPEIGNKKYLLYGLASIPPLIEGYLRVKALTHFPSDVMIGFAIGAFCGITVPSLHRYRNQNLSVSMISTPVGPGINLCYNIR